MRQMFTAMVAACAVAGAATAQVSTASAGGGVMPGQVVGSTVPLSPAGSQLPRAGMPAGNPVGNPYMKPNLSDPLNPFKGTGIDPKMLAAPAMGYPGSPYQQPDLFDKLTEKLNSITSFFTPSAMLRPATYTPGISRRNRERNEQRMWRRD